MCKKGKRVRFNDNVEIHYMHTWHYAYKKARISHWTMMTLDSYRFKRRIQEIANMLDHILLNKKNLK